MSNGVIVLVRNPGTGRPMPLTEDGGFLPLCFDTQAQAQAAASGHRLVQAWGGYVVDLDRMEVQPI